VAVCTFCGNEMLGGTGCSEEPVRVGDTYYEPIRWGDERGYKFWDVSARCGDCGVPSGAVHHHGCDLEQCPACEGQAITCGCRDDEEDY
jgi:hypothetical protein